MECLVEVSSKINATEDPEKVQQALKNIFPTGSEKIFEDSIKLQGDCSILHNLKEILEKRKIRAVARNIILQNLEGATIIFYLNKQAALVNVINIMEEDVSPLGDIKVKISTEDLDAFLDWLAPVPLNLDE